MTDTTIGVPTAEASGTAGADDDADDDETAADASVVSVHVPESMGWSEERLAPGESMDIKLPDGRTVAVVDVDEDADCGE